MELTVLWGAHYGPVLVDVARQRNRETTYPVSDIALYPDTYMYIISHICINV